MGYDLGAVVPLAVTVTDAAGDATDADTVTLAVTLPDGTAAAGITVTNPPATTGQYSYDYTPTQAGRHTVRWTTTGPATAYTDVFHVHAAGTAALISLAVAKAHLNIAAAVTTHDAELRDAILTASDVVEGIVGQVGRRTVVETHSGRGTPGLALRQTPALAVTEVTVNGTVVAADGYNLSDAGVLYRVSGYTDLSWPAGRNNITVTYTAGRTSTPPAVLDAVKELVRINFRPQLGGNYSPFDGAGGDDLGGGAVRLGFFVPNRIMTSLQRHADVAGFA